MSWINDNPTGYSIYNENTGNYVSEAQGGGAALFVTSDTALNLAQTYTLSPGGYSYSIQVRNHVAGGIRLYIYDRTNARFIYIGNPGWASNGVYSLPFSISSDCTVTITILPANSVTRFELANWSLLKRL